MGGTRLGYSSKHVEVEEALQAFYEEKEKLKDENKKNRHRKG
jgi:hypothetical protein